MSKGGNVVVCMRVRPFNKMELEKGANCCVNFHGDKMTCNIKTGDSEAAGKKYNFDRVFDMKTEQKEVYDMAAKPIIDSVLEGFNGTIFAYGQTSSGKTHTMTGKIDDLEL
jgi:kinesin family protein 5